MRQARTFDHAACGSDDKGCIDPMPTLVVHRSSLTSRRRSSDRRRCQVLTAMARRTTVDPGDHHCLLIFGRPRWLIGRIGSFVAILAIDLSMGSVVIQSMLEPTRGNQRIARSTATPGSTSSVIDDSS